MKFLNLFLAVSILSISNAYAAQDIQIETVKKMYQAGKKSENGMEVIEKYADAGLKQAFKVQEKFGEICGYEADVMWQSQDPEYNRALTFTKIANNQVKVNLAKGKWHPASSVTYKLSCNGNTCKVADVIDTSGSLKQNILKECR
jgi:hypothetical protein